MTSLNLFGHELVVDNFAGGGGASRARSRMTEKTEILPCPFCGSGDVDAAGWLDGQGMRGPECLCCGATAQSVKYWNRRQSERADTAREGE